MVSKVAHFDVLDVHPRLSRILVGSAVASLAVVGDLRDGPDVRPTIFFVFIGGVCGGVLSKHLTRWV